MKLTVYIGKVADLNVESFNRMLRLRIPELVGWSYTYETGELTLDFGETEDERLMAKIQEWLTKAEAAKPLRLEFLGVVKEW